MTRYPDGIEPGLDLGSKELVLTRDWVEKYLGSIDAHNAWYTSDSPFGGPIAPAATFNYEMELFKNWHPPYAKGNVLNTDQSWEFHRPMRVGQRVTMRGRVAARYLRRNREHISMESTAYDDAGHSLLRSVTTHAWPAPPDCVAPEQGAEAVSPPLARLRERTSGVSQRGEGSSLHALDAPIAFEPPPFERLITRGMCITNGAPMKNFHTDLADAKKLGFPDLVAAGPMIVCFYSEMLTRCFGASWVAGGAMRFKLLKPVIAADVIAARAKVTAHEARGSDMLVALDIWCERRADGVKTSVGTAWVTLPR